MKNELLEQEIEIYPNPTYKIQKIADKFSEGDFEIKILFLSTAHSNVKRGIATRNITFRLSVVEDMTRTGAQTYTPNEFAEYEEHVKLEEIKYK